MFKARKLLFVSLFACLLITLPAIAAEKVGPMSVSTAAIQWQPQVGAEGLTLVVMGPDGLVLTRDFNAGPVVLRIQDLGGKVPANGSYTYELRATPRISEEVKRQLRAAHEANDTDAVARIQKEAGIGEPVVQSGGFMILNGGFVTDTPERAGTPVLKPKSDATHVLKPAPTDQIVNDDEEIVGSLCVGLDCVLNESFGFDTIRLKENNTRIKFQDTSTGAGFPNNVWQLTANDSNSGGLNKFSIDDITGSKTPFTTIAGAPTNSLFIASNGKVGFGNAAPVLNLHITATDTPAIRQEQTSGGGFTAQTWDIGANEANWFVRDVTGGSRLPFRIRPGAPTSSIDISATGKVGVGTASPSEQLHIFNMQDANTIGLIQNTSATANATAILRSSSDTASVNLQSNASARTITRWGQTLGGWSEVLQISGNGLAVGTLGATPLILGTNSAARITIGSSGGVTVTGDFTVSGGTKNFAMPDPANAQKAIYYAALEGPEAGTYYRGTARTVNGQAVIQLPGFFARITETERMTVQLTPVGAYGQVYVAERSPEQIVIKTASGSDDVEFDYFVQGVRKGYLDYQVERSNDLPRN